MDWKTEFNRWLNFSDLDTDLKEQLENLKGNTEQLEDSFYKHLEFGTGGMRGIIGPVTNRMNTYTVRKAAEGLARYIDEEGETAKHRGVVIAYDSRHRSEKFSFAVSKTLGQHAYHTYVFESLLPKL